MKHLSAGVAAAVLLAGFGGLPPAGAAAPDMTVPMPPTAGPAAPPPASGPPTASSAGDIKPVAFTRMVLNLPIGQAWMIQQGGMFCIIDRTLTYAGGRQDFNIAGFKEAFYDEFKADGLKLEGDPDNLFEPSTGESADYAIAGVISDLHEVNCTPNLRVPNQKGHASMSIDWQVYSRLEKQVVATVHTTGSADLTDPQPGGIPILLIRAFTENVRQLAADPALRKALAGAARGESELVKPESFDKTALIGAMAAGPRNVDDAVSSVVLVRAGGDEGSGVLISKDGYIVTAAHVVGDAPRVKVRWSDGIETDATVVRAIRGRDVALLKTDPHGRTPLALRRDEPAVGDPVFAIGSEYGEKFQSSVTKGVMSADRVVDGYAYIQSDVTIAPGSSGGPLLDGQGRVIGLTLLGFRPAGIPTGINLFVPTRDVEDFLALSPQ